MSFGLDLENKKLIEDDDYMLWSQPAKKDKRNLSDKTCSNI